MHILINNVSTGRRLSWQIASSKAPS